MKPWLRQILTVLLLVASLALLFRLSPRLMTEELLATDDFVEYWAAGRLNLQGNNPYSPEQLKAMQLQTGRTYQIPVRLWSLPSILPLIMPYGAFDYPFSRFLWFLSHIALLGFCAAYLWRFFGGSAKLTWVAFLLAFSFLPTLMMLKIGQIGTFMLFGIVLFLMFTERRAWWLASLAMLFMANKPQILYLVPFAFVLWAAYQRRWALLAGSGLGVLLAIGIALLFNPRVLRQYYDFVSAVPPDGITPTLGGLLRYYWGPEKMWLQVLPAALGGTWFALYWFKRRLAWNWSEQMPLIVMVSVFIAPYGWTFDYVVLLPVIISVAAKLCRQSLSPATVLVIALYFAIEALAFKWPFQDYFTYAWLAPALAAWFFLTVRLGTGQVRT